MYVLARHGANAPKQPSVEPFTQMKESSKHRTIDYGNLHDSDHEQFELCTGNMVRGAKSESKVDCIPVLVA